LTGFDSKAQVFKPCAGETKLSYKFLSVSSVIRILGKVGRLIMATAHEAIEETTETSPSPAIDSKYRLIIMAAKRSRQLQRGARPRIEIDPTKHKPTRIALEEIVQGTVPFHLTANGDAQSDGADE
jgi:DNA-directed RNA polymerase subunit omega